VFMDGCADRPSAICVRRSKRDRLSQNLGSSSATARFRHRCGGLGELGRLWHERSDFVRAKTLARRATKAGVEHLFFTGHERSVAGCALLGRRATLCRDGAREFYSRVRPLGCYGENVVIDSSPRGAPKCRELNGSVNAYGGEPSRNSIQICKAMRARSSAIESHESTNYDNGDAGFGHCICNSIAADRVFTEQSIPRDVETQSREINL
jgi:hypothetical protein